MKLLAVTGYYKPAYVYGGPVRCEAALFEGLAGLGVEVKVITTNANGSGKLDVPLLTPLEVGGVQVIYCPTRPAPGSPFYSPAQVQAVRRCLPGMDIVNLQTFWGYATHPLSQACKKHRIPYYVSLHGQLMDYALQGTGWFKRLKKRLFLELVGYRYLNQAAALHCTSDAEMAHLQAHPIHTPAFLVPNSLEVSAFRNLPPRGQLRAQFQIPEKALLMVMVGRLDAIKNPRYAVAALIATQQLPVPVHLLVVGPDQHKLSPALQEQARQAGCASRLHFTGLLQKSALLQALADADLLVMPSESENFGMAAAEGMAAGLPILVTEPVPVGSWACQAQAGKTTPLDENAFCRAAVEMLSHPAQLKEMGRHAQTAAARFFDNQAVAKEMLTHLEQIVAPSNKLYAQSI